VGLFSVAGGVAGRRREVFPFAVGVYFPPAFWFPSPFSFANPAVTLARAFSDTFAGIHPVDAPGFIVAQILGAAATTLLFRWLAPTPTQEAPAATVRYKERTEREEIHR